MNFYVSETIHLTLTWSTWGHSQGKNTLKLNSSTYKKYGYGHLGSWYIKLNLFLRGSKLEQISPKNKEVTGKTQFFAIGPFCSRHSICFSIGFWQNSFEWKWCFQSLWFQLKNGTPVFWKRFSFSRKVVPKLQYWKRL